VNNQATIERISTVRSATLGTVCPDGSPHLVPCVFAVDAPLFFIPVDGKRKRSRELKRLNNLKTDPRAVLLFHGWDEDWSRLWWVSVKGEALILRTPSDMNHARHLLLARYSQYRTPEELDPIIQIQITKVIEWRADREATP
jgi:PPOX class probable F420-dependent enzyme